MAQTGEIDLAILRDLERQGPCDLEELVRRLPGYTWNQVFVAVDRLNRDAKLQIQHPTRFEYVVSIVPSRKGAEYDSAGSD